MNGVIEIMLKNYEIFLLVLIRTSGIFFISPFFSSQNVPNTIKIGFSMMISLLLAVVLDTDANFTNTGFMLLVFKELMVGVIIGFIGYVFSATFYIMGQIIDMKIGFGMVNVMDPQHRIQVPIMGNFYYILAFLILLSINGHHSIINALVDSYEFIPIGEFIFNRDIMDVLVNLLSETFIIGFRLSIPVVAIIFLTDLLLGMLARAIPQMNVFMVGMPLKILIGFVIIGISIPLFYSIVVGMHNSMVEKIYIFLKLHIKG
ncbi:MAG: flagellar type III secretion system protein FliR [Tissierellia bacterium]|nr:flagellar type III secretion system protein FliR [Tissierellia bacterium]